MILSYLVSIMLLFDASHFWFALLLMTWVVCLGAKLEVHRTFLIQYVGQYRNYVWQDFCSITYYWHDPCIISQSIWTIIKSIYVNHSWWTILFTMAIHEESNASSNKGKELSRLQCAVLCWSCNCFQSSRKHFYSRHLHYSPAPHNLEHMNAEPACCLPLCWSLPSAKESQVTLNCFVILLFGPKCTYTYMYVFWNAGKGLTLKACDHHGLSLECWWNVS